MSCLTPTEFFATLLFNRPGLTAKQLRDAYLRYTDRDPCEKVTKERYVYRGYKRGHWVEKKVFRWAGWYSSYFYTPYQGKNRGWNSNGRQLGRLWKSGGSEKVKIFFLLPKGYRKVVIGVDGMPLDLSQSLSTQLSFQWDQRKCA